MLFLSVIAEIFPINIDIGKLNYCIQQCIVIGNKHSIKVSIDGA